jgi:hypothetical protein
VVVVNEMKVGGYFKSIFWLQFVSAKLKILAVVLR